MSTAPLSRAAYGHYLAGKHALYRDDAATAASELLAAAQAAPEQPMVAVEAARALAKAKREPEALTLLATTRGQWPDHAQVWLASGELLEKASPADAVRAYRRTIELDRDDERAYLGLARVQLAEHDPAGSEKTLRSLVARVPGSVDGHYRLAQRLEARGDRAAAASELRAVIEHDPDHIDARLDLARTLRRLGKLPEAIAQTRSAFDRAAQPLDVAEELFWLLCEADDRQAAIDLLTLLDDDRSDGDALAIVARLDTGLGRFSEAREVIARIAALDPDAGALALAELELVTHEPTAAADAQRVAETSPYFAAARRIAAEADLASGAPAAALETLAPARKAKPRDPELALLEAMAQADAKHPDDARALLAGMRREHDDPALQLAQARLEDHLHDTARALSILEPFLVAHPDNITALNLAGYLLANARQRLDDAERYLRRARDLAPGDPAVVDSWGWLQLQRGRTRDAVRALDRAARFAPTEPEILVHAATAYAADHAPKPAAELLDRAAALHPTPDVQARIEKLRATL